MQNASVSALDKEITFDQTNKEKLIRNKVGSFASTDDMATPNIGHDMWTQLKRVEIPLFSGNKRTYPSWKAAFIACIDKTPVSPEYKMLQLQQYVSGEALRAIENLGHSPSAYEAAKDRLERKYGGKRRQKGTSRQRSGKGAIRKRFPLQKPRWEKTKLTIRHLYHETYRKPNEQLFSQ